MMFVRQSGLALVVVLWVSAQVVSAVNIVPGFASSSMSRNDDATVGRIDLGFTLNFLGNTYSGLFVNNNGNVTFDAPLASFTPFMLQNTSRKIIAPFFADVDTRGMASDVTRYGQGLFNGRSAFGVTWNGVGYYPSASDKLNKFQLILVDRGDMGLGDFDIYFHYDQIMWETGGASGGSGGIGGNSARAGYSAGYLAPFYELPGSAVRGAFLDGGINSLVAGSNIGKPGQYFFTIRNGVPRPSVPEFGASALLVLLGLGAVQSIRRFLA